MTLLVFDDPPAVFIRVRKTGTTSLLRGVFGGLGAAVAESQGSFDPAWRDRFVFAFVRNPFDRLVSCYEMFRQYKTGSEQEAALRAGLTIAQMIEIAQDESLPLGGNSYIGKLRQHAIPASHPSYHIHEARFIGRFESFSADYRRLCKHLGRPARKSIPHMRETAPRDYRVYFDPVTRKAAEHMLAQDLERFGYDF